MDLRSRLFAGFTEFQISGSSKTEVDPSLMDPPTVTDGPARCVAALDDGVPVSERTGMPQLVV